MTFTANAESLVSGGHGGVRVWRVKDGEQLAATMQGRHVLCVAVSKDGRLIAAGSNDGEVWVWGGTTYQQALFVRKIPGLPIYDVDFSPDSSRLVSANESNRTATICDIAARKKVQTLDHGDRVYAAKYSPQGDKIATATYESVRVWDSDDGQLLVDVKVELVPWRGLLWFDCHLFVTTKDSKITQIDASTGSAISEWSVPYDYSSWIALPQHGKFIACSTKDKITFWDTSTHTHLAHIPRRSERGPIAFSLDNQLAIVSWGQKVIIKTFPLVKVRPRVLSISSRT